MTKDLPLSRVMAKARREGRKNQTRRIVKPQPEFGRAFLCGALDEVNVFRTRNKTGGWHHCDPSTFTEIYCPYGKPGDRLRWLTTWATRKEWDHLKPSRLPKDSNWSEYFWSFHDSDNKPEWCGRLRPGRFLPGFLRHLMPVDEIVSVRVERLNEISEEDVIAEGINRIAHGRSGYYYSAFHNEPDPKNWCHAVPAYKALWQSINGPGSWDRNPYVWCISFRRINAS